MTTYTPLPNFGAKDSLPEHDPDKVVRGIDFTNEFNAIAAALSSKADAGVPVLSVGNYSFEVDAGDLVIKEDDIVMFRLVSLSAAENPGIVQASDFQEGTTGE